MGTEGYTIFLDEVPIRTFVLSRDPYMDDMPPPRISKEDMKKAKEIERKKWLESIKKMNAKKGRK